MTNLKNREIEMKSALEILGEVKGTKYDVLNDKELNNLVESIELAEVEAIMEEDIEEQRKDTHQNVEPTCMELANEMIDFLNYNPNMEY